MTSLEKYDSFIRQFPLEKLSSMTLEQYTNLDKKDSFCYWLEAKTSDLGSIWGGSSYKFGIYKYNVLPKRKDPNDTSFKYDDEYAWLSKHGVERDQAFDRIRNMISDIAHFANDGDFESIDNIDLGDTYKWKIAFLYSNQKLISIFNPNILSLIAKEIGLTDADSKPVSTLQRFLLDKKDSEINIFDYSNHLWNLANKIIPQKESVWLYAPGDKARLWEDFYKDGIMAIGWDELHDLSRYKDQMEINMDIQQHYDTNKNKSNDAKSCYDFCHNIKIGDTIIVKKGLYEILGVGIVRSDYYFDDTAEEFCHKRNVSWISKGCWRYPTYLPQKTLTKKDLSFKKDIMEIINKVEMPQKSKEIKSILLSKKQIILQGAPGTGKTYNTAELAVAICNKDFSDFGNREAVMTEYNNLKKSGQIAFTTFHQSMDYEEFVEGLRPVNNSDGVTFETKNGLFKEICERALLSNIKFNKEIAEELDFEELYDSLLHENITIKTKTGKEIEFKSNSNQNLKFKYKSSPQWSTLAISKGKLKALFDTYKSKEEFNKIININSSIREIIGGCDSTAYWAILNHFFNNIEVSSEEQIDMDNLTSKSKESAIQSYFNKNKDLRNALKEDEKQNFVLIIDEINRGNISKILGELITLLEHDKRIDCVNELTAKLPYSQDNFGVPSNLYIIGTMNTADRSVGHIDYAIRRRFSFISLHSDVNVIESEIKDEDVRGTSKKLFEKVEAIMNSTNIEFNKEDLMIGHSYFIAQTKEELKMKLEYDIKPLLREYANDGILNFHKDHDTRKYREIEELTID